MKRKLTSVILSLALCLSLFPTGAWAAEVRTLSDAPEGGGQVMPLSAGSFAGAESGSGAAADPYLITDAGQFKAFRDYINAGNDGKGEYFKLTVDIELDPSENWTPIGSQAAPFAGTFDGGIHLVSGLYINSSDDNLGLFGYVAKGGTVTNLGVDGTVTGNNLKNTGGVVGYSAGTVTKCYNTGAVTGTFQVGGVVGNSSEGGTVTKCYNTGAVTGYGYVGGVAGYSGGSTVGATAPTLTDSYNTGAVTGTRGTAGDYIGGVVGNIADGSVQRCYNYGQVTDPKGYTGGVAGNTTAATVTNCYYLDTCGAAGLGSSKTADDFANQNLYAFDFDWGNSYSDVWGAGGWYGRPMLRETPEWIYVTEAGGNYDPNDFGYGTEISLETVMRHVVGNYKVYAPYGSNPRSHTEGDAFKLTTDLVVNNSTSDQIAANPSWTPIGSTSRDNAFKGTFDGDGHTITLDISGDSIYFGLFGQIDGGTVRNLDITGTVKCTALSAKLTTLTYIYIGGVAGYIYNGTVENCSFSGTVEGDSASIGGVVGYSSGTVENCSFSGTVTGTCDLKSKTSTNNRELASAGGVVGYSSGKVSNCYNTGTVTGSITGPGTFTGDAAYTIYASQAGGVVGYNSGEVSNCYNTGDVSVALTSVNSMSYSQAGGVAGYNTGSNSAVTNCYNTGDVSGTVSSSMYQYSQAGGVVGYNTGSSSAVTNCYNTGDVTGSATEGATTTSGMTVGGVAGASDGTTANCYFLKNCSVNMDKTGIGDGTDTNAAPINALEFAVESTFPGWDLNGVWEMGGMGGEAVRPVLRSVREDITAALRGECAHTDESQCGGSCDCADTCDCKPTGRYAVNIGQLENGSITTDRSAAPEGAEVRLTVMPAADCMLVPDSLTVTPDDPDQGPVNVSAVQDGEGEVYAFTMPGCPVTVTALFGLITEVEEFFDAANGNGSDTDPYLITTPAQLEAFRNYVNGTAPYHIPHNGAGEYFKLGNDIALNASANWAPIGNLNTSFTGTFDGGGYTVSGLYIDTDTITTRYCGLFGSVGSGGTVKDLGVEGSITVVNGGGTGNTISGEAGGVVGNNEGTILNCRSGVVVTGYASVGGVVGFNKGTVENCTNTGAVTGTSNAAGGVVGSNYGDVKKCRNTAAVKGASYVGGIVGQSYSASGDGAVENCYNTGSVARTGATSSGIGGVVGDLQSSTVKNCYNTGTVTGGSTDTGGVVGNRIGATVQNSYYLANTANGGIGGQDDAASNVVYKTEAEFLSGEVAWLLQNGQTGQIWGQTLKAAESGAGSAEFDVYPLLTSQAPAAPKVFRVTLDYNYTGAPASRTAYANADLKSVADPSRNAYSFGGWYKEAGCTTEFSSAPEDTTIYAKWARRDDAFHTITIDPSMENGTVESDKAEAAADEVVTLTVKPGDGYRLTAGSLAVTDEDGAAVPVNDGNVEGVYTFTMPDGAVTVTARFELLPPVVTQISVTAQPKLIYMAGDPLDLTGLVLRITYSYGVDKILTYSVGSADDFDGFEFNFPHGTSLTRDDDGKSITVSCGQITVSIGTLMVSYDDPEGSLVYYDPVKDEILEPEGAVAEVAGSSDPATWNSGWYVAKGMVTLRSATVNGNVNLILGNGCILTVTDGIAFANSGASLTIWGQSADYKTNGRLIVNGSGSDTSDGKSAIGGDRYTYANDTLYNNSTVGSLTVNGGQITATGGSTTATPEAAKSGSSDTGVPNNWIVYGGNAICVKTLTVNGGIIDATGGAGTGSSTGDLSTVIYYGGDGIYGLGSITIAGGSVKAKGGNGYGNGGNGISMAVPNYNIAISGGDVKAYGGNATGVYLTIGNGGNGICTYAHYKGWEYTGYNDIQITGGSVAAYGGSADFDQASGFRRTSYTGNGGSGIKNRGIVAISGTANVIAEGGNGTARGGTGLEVVDNTAKVKITISGSTVFAYGGDQTLNYGSTSGGYGGGSGISSHTTVEVSGSEVTAECGQGENLNGMGIYAEGGAAITDSTVTAVGGKGRYYVSNTHSGGLRGGPLTITDSTVTATGGDHGIYGSTIVVTDSQITAAGATAGEGATASPSTGIYATNSAAFNGTGSTITASGKDYGIYLSSANGGAVTINGGTVIAAATVGTGYAFNDMPEISSEYTHITTSRDGANLYERTGKSADAEAWKSWKDVKIQPLAGIDDKLTVTAEPTAVRLDDGNDAIVDLTACLVYVLGDAETLTEDVTADSQWTLSGSESESGSTEIITGEDGARQLVVGADETAEKLTVTAAYPDPGDASKPPFIGSATVSVMAAPKFKLTGLKVNGTDVSLKNGGTQAKPGALTVTVASSVTEFTITAVYEGSGVVRYGTAKDTVAEKGTALKSGTASGAIKINGNEVTVYIYAAPANAPDGGAYYYELTVTKKSSSAAGTGGGTVIGGGGGGTTSSTTTTNPDGSTTTTTTDRTTGTVTESTKNNDGTTTTKETQKDGTVTETKTNTDGSTKAVEKKTDGTVTTTEKAANGVEVKTVAQPGQSVTATVTIPEEVESAVVTIPDAEITPGTVAVDADTGEIIMLSVPTEDGMDIKLDSSRNIILVDNSKEFADVGGVDHWAENSVAFVSSHGLFVGTGDNTFSPEENTSRAQLMTVLARLDGADTSGNALQQGMEWAVAAGISDGSTPDEDISRQQVAVMLWRYAGSPESSQALTATDAGDAADYARTALAWAVEVGILTGYPDGSLKPGDSASRAHVAAMVQRFCAAMV